MQIAARPFEASGELPDYRSLFLDKGVHPYLTHGLLYKYGRSPNPDGPHPGELLDVHTFTRPVKKLLSATLNLTQLSAADSPGVGYPVFASMALLNARFLVMSSRQDGEKVLAVIEMPKYSPILVSNSIVPTLDDSGSTQILRRSGYFDRLLAYTRADTLPDFSDTFAMVLAMQVHPPTSTCKTIFISDLQQRETLGTSASVEVLNHRVFQQRVELEVRVSSDCFARLAYSYYPHMQIVVDGQPHQAMETAGHFIALRLSEGTHKIVLQHQLSLLRKALFAVAALALIATVVLFLIETPDSRWSRFRSRWTRN